MFHTKLDLAEGSPLLGGMAVRSKELLYAPLEQIHLIWLQTKCEPQELLASPPPFCADPIIPWIFLETL